MVQLHPTAIVDWCPTAGQKRTILITPIAAPTTFLSGLTLLHSDLSRHPNLRFLYLNVKFVNQNTPFSTRSKFHIGGVYLACSVE